MTVRLLDPSLLRNVTIDGFTPETHAFVKRFLEDLTDATEPVGRYALPESAALLFFVLRHLPESEFPGGKWATIQALEGAIENATSEWLALHGVAHDPRSAHVTGDELLARAQGRTT